MPEQSSAAGRARRANRDGARRRARPAAICYFYFAESAVAASTPTSSGAESAVAASTPTSAKEAGRGRIERATASMHTFF